MELVVATVAAWITDRLLRPILHAEMNLGIRECRALDADLQRQDIARINIRKRPGDWRKPITHSTETTVNNRGVRARLSVFHVPAFEITIRTEREFANKDLRSRCRSYR